MSYRDNSKPKKVLYIDVSEVPAKHVEWFIKGAEAAIKAVEAADETNQTHLDRDGESLDD